MSTIRILSTAEGAPGDVAFTLSADEVSLGRELDNSIVLTDRAVSRHHARIMKTTRGHLLVDSGSGNGIWMGKNRVNNYFLSDGDVFRIGRTLLKFEEEAFDPLRAGVRGSTDGIPTWDSSSATPVIPPVFVLGLVAVFVLTLGAAILVVVLSRSSVEPAPSTADPGSSKAAPVRPAGSPAAPASK